MIYMSGPASHFPWPRNSYFYGTPECSDQAVKIGEDLRTTDNPCGLYCSRMDFVRWRAAARQRLTDVMQKSDLTAEAMTSAKKMLSEVDTTNNPSTFTLGDATHRMAELYRFANCLSTIPAGDELPVVPDPPKDPADKLQSFATLAVIAGALYLANKLIK